MRIFEVSEINEVNRILFTVSSLADEEGSCSISSVIESCSQQVFAGRAFDHYELIRICDYAKLLASRKGHITLTDLGNQFIGLNSDFRYEINQQQEDLIVNELIFRGPWRNLARDLFLNFRPNYDRLTFELPSDLDLPSRNSRIFSVLKRLRVIRQDSLSVHVASEAVPLVIEIRSDTQTGLTQDEFDLVLTRRQNLGSKAEEAILKFEQQRLEALGLRPEAALVQRISQLDVSAGYDIRSFDGMGSALEHNRFIEVKASQGAELRFFLTLNECRVATQLGDKYWIYFVPAFSERQIDQVIPLIIQNPIKTFFGDSYSTLTASRVANIHLKNYVLLVEQAGILITTSIVFGPRQARVISPASI